MWSSSAGRSISDNRKLAEFCAGELAIDNNNSGGGSDGVAMSTRLTPHPQYGSWSDWAQFNCQPQFSCQIDEKFELDKVYTDDPVLYSANVNALSNKESTNSTLSYLKAPLYGLCPAGDEFFSVKCKQCGTLVKPVAYRAHMNYRHNIMLKSPEFSGWFSWNSVISPPPPGETSGTTANTPTPGPSSSLAEESAASATKTTNDPSATSINFTNNKKPCSPCPSATTNNTNVFDKFYVGKQKGQSKIKLKKPNNASTSTSVRKRTNNNLLLSTSDELVDAGGGQSSNTLNLRESDSYVVTQKSDHRLKITISKTSLAKAPSNTTSTKWTIPKISKKTANIEIPPTPSINSEILKELAQSDVITIKKTLKRETATPCPVVNVVPFKESDQSERFRAQTSDIVVDPQRTFPVVPSDILEVKVETSIADTAAFLPDTIVNPCLSFNEALSSNNKFLTSTASASDVIAATAAFDDHPVTQKCELSSHDLFCPIDSTFKATTHPAPIAISRYGGRRFGFGNYLIYDRRLDMSRRAIEVAFNDDSSSGCNACTSTSNYDQCYCRRRTKYADKAKALANNDVCSRNKLDKSSEIINELWPTVEKVTNSNSPHAPYWVNSDNATRQHGLSSSWSKKVPIPPPPVLGPMVNVNARYINNSSFYRPLSISIGTPREHVICRQLPQPANSSRSAATAVPVSAMTSGMTMNGPRSYVTTSQCASSTSAGVASPTNPSGAKIGATTFPSIQASVGGASQFTPQTSCFVVTTREKLQVNAATGSVTSASSAFTTIGLSGISTEKIKISSMSNNNNNGLNNFASSCNIGGPSGSVSSSSSTAVGCFTTVGVVAPCFSGSLASYQRNGGSGRKRSAASLGLTGAGFGHHSINHNSAVVSGATIYGGLSTSTGRSIKRIRPSTGLEVIKVCSSGGGSGVNANELISSGIAGANTTGNSSRVTSATLTTRQRIINHAAHRHPKIGGQHQFGSAQNHHPYSTLHNHHNHLTHQQPQQHSSTTVLRHQPSSTGRSASGSSSTVQRFIKNITVTTSQLGSSSATSSGSSSPNATVLTLPLNAVILDGNRVYTVQNGPNGPKLVESASMMDTVVLGGGLNSGKSAADAAAAPSFSLAGGSTRAIQPKLTTTLSSASSSLLVSQSQATSTTNLVPSASGNGTGGVSGTTAFLIHNTKNGYVSVQSASSIGAGPSRQSVYPQTVVVCAGNYEGPSTAASATSSTNQTPPPQQQQQLHQSVSSTSWVLNIRPQKSASKGLQS